ncbi:MAG TPA: hypothetical protein PK876_10225, partial [Elusimicrobiota bacterium]|nr:hypothetical protein [Elusimicrobiota bacterium]
LSSLFAGSLLVFSSFVPAFSAQEYRRSDFPQLFRTYFDQDRADVVVEELEQRFSRTGNDPSLLPLLLKALQILLEDSRAQKLSVETHLLALRLSQLDPDNPHWEQTARATRPREEEISAHETLVFTTRESHRRTLERLRSEMDFARYKTEHIRRRLAKYSNRMKLLDNRISLIKLNLAMVNEELLRQNILLTGREPSRRQRKLLAGFQKKKSQLRKRHIRMQAKYQAYSERCAGFQDYINRKADQDQAIFSEYAMVFEKMERAHGAFQRIERCLRPPHGRSDTSFDIDDYRLPVDMMRRGTIHSSGDESPDGRGEIRREPRSAVYRSGHIRDWITRTARELIASPRPESRSVVSSERDPSAEWNRSIPPAETISTMEILAVSDKKRPAPSTPRKIDVPPSSVALAVDAVRPSPALPVIRPRSPAPRPPIVEAAVKRDPVLPRPSRECPLLYKPAAGEVLPEIARRFYSDPSQWMDIYSANRSQMSKGLVPDGQYLLIPCQTNP